MPLWAHEPSSNNILALSLRLYRPYFISLAPHYRQLYFRENSLAASTASEWMGGEQWNILPGLIFLDIQISLYIARIPSWRFDCRWLQYGFYRRYRQRAAILFAHCIMLERMRGIAISDADHDFIDTSRMTGSRGQITVLYFIYFYQWERGVDAERRCL